MKRIHVKSLKAINVNTNDNELVLIALDEKGLVVEMRFPTDVIWQAGAEAQRATLAQVVQKAGPETPPRVAGDRIVLMNAASFEVAPLPKEKAPAVALIMDRGTQVQLGYRIPADAAERLGQQLLEKGKLSRTLAARPPAS